MPIWSIKLNRILTTNLIMCSVLEISKFWWISIQKVNKNFKINLKIQMGKQIKDNFNHSLNIVFSSNFVVFACWTATCNILDKAFQRFYHFQVLNHDKNIPLKPVYIPVNLPSQQVYLNKSTWVYLSLPYWLSAIKISCYLLWSFLS